MLYHGPVRIRAFNLKRFLTWALTRLAAGSKLPNNKAGNG